MGECGMGESGCLHNKNQTRLNLMLIKIFCMVV